MIKIRFSASHAAGAHCLILPIAKSGLETAPLAGDATLVRAAAQAARFDGEAGSVFEQHIAHESGAQRLLLLGVGAASAEDLEKAGSAITAKLLTSGESDATLDLAPLSVSADAVARMAAAAALRSWRYDSYRTKLPEKQKPTLQALTLVGAPEGSEAAWARQSALVEGVSLTRELVTEPANIIYPESFVARCQRLKDAGVEIEVLGEAEMRAAGMGALLGVAQGSIREPKLLVMRWDGTNGAQKKPVVFVGKGVTFDTGGISLKPAAGMEDMKWDMGGAGAVAGAMLALAGRKAKAHVVGVCGLVENMPDGNAQRPGDVVTSMSGQTIEVINTDAEGRLVLCDAMTWVQKRFEPEYMVDLATLTGAMIISLGHEYGGLFSNDDGLAEKLTAAGKAVGDPLWRFPIGAAYDKLIDSPIADMKNVGPREGGSITAAQFLQRFVDEGVKWAHLDIAGMVWAAKPGTMWDKGATGFGVRLLDRFVADN
ncbi:MAG: leucyl aminopeptidase, partial [Alphaproteobacteria bacterium]|nr:leucyl aminopeptidase [Alphaproteobacteria bacterium]